MGTLELSHLNIQPAGPGSSGSGYVNRTTQANLLIPERLVERYRVRLARHRGASRYLNYLLKNYQERLLQDVKNSPESRRANKVYQHRGLDLVRAKMRLPESEWREFCELSHITGYSCCRLYVMLLIMDLGTPIRENGKFQVSRFKLVKTWSEMGKGSSWWVVEFMTRGEFRNLGETRVFKYVKPLWR